MAAVTSTLPIQSYTGGEKEVQKIKIEWSYTVLDLFKKILAPGDFESLDRFGHEIEVIYRVMTNILQKTHPGCNLLASNREAIDKTCSELYLTIILGRKRKTPDSELITTLVKSTIFQGLIPDSEELLTKNNEKNYNFFLKQLSPRRLKEFPSLQSSKEILHWFTLVTLSITAREDQDKFSLTSDLPQKIMDKAAEERERIGKIMFASFDKSDCKLLIQLFNNDKVSRVFGEYMNMFKELREGDKDYSPQVRDSIKVGLTYLLEKLPASREEVKADTSEKA